jgi:hypothetical protein
MKRNPQRDWTSARAKVIEEGACRGCGRSDRKIDCAHVLGRAYDELVGMVRRVDPRDIVPLCGPVTNPDTCHARYDAHRLDLYPFLTQEERERALELAGSEGVALRRIRGRPWLET